MNSPSGPSSCRRSCSGSKRCGRPRGAAFGGLHGRAGRPGTTSGVRGDRRTCAGRWRPGVRRGRLRRPLGPVRHRRRDPRRRRRRRGFAPGRRPRGRRDRLDCSAAGRTRNWPLLAGVALLALAGVPATLGRAVPFALGIATLVALEGSR
ncbi:hypothetical protein ACFQL1_17795 [Halomicroarcula sp. GCM10025709]|uniref:hypothetical protein n=1 Tax=Halomicroarcula sp. GCM10025709 TaxID=3252669 RepID=UPI00361E635D